MSPSWTSHGPLSLQGGLAVKGAEAAAARLTVVDHPDADSAAGGSAPPALVSAATAAALGGAGPLLLQLGGGSDCVVGAAVDARVPDGRIALSPAAQHNFHLAPGYADEWTAFAPPAVAPFDLVSLEVEVSVLGQPSASEVVLDAALLGPHFAKQWFGRVLAVNEVALLAHAGHQLLLRVTAADTLDAEAQAEQLGYHCYRGRLAPGTQLYLAASGSGSDGGSSSSSGGGAGLAQSVTATRSRVRLINATPRPAAGPPRRAVGVTTSDGEWFPVQRALLRPCIALTKVIRSDEDSPSVTVDIDTLTFDRVLIFLESLALGRPPPSFGIHLAAQLLDAGRKLGLRALEEHCEGKLEAVVSRQRRHSFAEIVRRNTAGGECLLVLDGMVLDVTRWLPEHPGGDTIIPQQALNLDCSRFFEVYHSSRESFVYLQEFYVGEVVAEDRGGVPQPEEAASPEFMEQLRQYTAPFRMPEEDRAYKSF